MPARRHLIGHLVGRHPGRHRRFLGQFGDLGINPDELAWREDANCSGTDPDAFFPDVENGRAVAVVKRVCAACPVRTACLDYALARPELVGIWGGTTTNQRRQLRKTTRQRQHHPLEEAA